MLLAHDRTHRVASRAIDLGRVDRLAAGARRIEPRQRARPRRAAGMGRQYSRGAAPHRFALVISTGGKGAKARDRATGSPAPGRRTSPDGTGWRSEEHTSELQSPNN